MRLAHRQTYLISLNAFRMMSFERLEMRDIILITLAFLGKFLFDASLEDGIN